MLTALVEPYMNHEDDLSAVEYLARSFFSPLKDCGRWSSKMYILSDCRVLVFSILVLPLCTTTTIFVFIVVRACLLLHDSGIGQD